MVAGPNADVACIIVDYIQQQPRAPTRESLPRPHKTPRREAGPVVHGRPFDIYVEFALGARVLALYGSTSAWDKAKESPLCSADWQSEQRARRRAGLE